MHWRRTCRCCISNVDVECPSLMASFESRRICWRPKSVTVGNSKLSVCSGGHQWCSCDYEVVMFSVMYMSWAPRYKKMDSAWIVPPWESDLLHEPFLCGNGLYTITYRAVERQYQPVFFISFFSDLAMGWRVLTSKSRHGLSRRCPEDSPRQHLLS